MSSLFVYKFIAVCFSLLVYLPNWVYYITEFLTRVQVPLFYVEISSCSFQIDTEKHRNLFHFRCQSLLGCSVDICAVNTELIQSSIAQMKNYLPEYSPAIEIEK